MATVYSLICFAGNAGKTVTFTDAGDVVNLTNHGLHDGTGVVFTDNAGNTLPTGLSKDTTYYAKSTGANTFTLWTTSGLTTQVTFTGTGTGTHKVKSAYYFGLTTDQKNRYGGDGSLIYDGIVAWNTGRAGASEYDTEICEIGEAFDDILTASLNLTVPSASSIIWSKVDGTRSGAWHGGNFSAGYRIIQTGSGNPIFPFKYNIIIDGIRYKTTNSNGGGFDLQKPGCIVRNCLLWGNLGIGQGITLSESSTWADSNIIRNFGYAMGMAAFRAGIKATNNLLTGNTTGWVGPSGNMSNVAGFYYNNISVGNTTNWGTAPGQIEGADKNAGLSGEAWIAGSGTRITIATTDFASFSNASETAGDFDAALVSSPQVDSGVAFFGITNRDVADVYRPSYNNGGAEGLDVGPLERDNGFGEPPEVHTIDFSGLVAGSQVIIFTTNTTTERLRNNSSGTTLTYDGGNGAVVDYTILKAGYIPIRVTGVSLTATSTPVAVSQQLDRAYVTPSGLTFGTNVIVNVTNRVVTSMQVTVATTVQNWYSYLIDCFIASATNTTLKNVAFPVIPFGEASFTNINGIEFSDGATSISKFKRDGFRYSSDAGVTATAIWSAILTLNTPAGQQVKYRQSSGGSIVNAANTGPMDQLVQVYGDASHGNFDYRGHMVLRAPKPGWSQPKPDLVATYGNLVDGLFVAALEPVLQYATTDADLDAANLALDNTAKTYTITAAHTMAELYQRAQWWANQDAQWDADIPLTTTNGGTFTQPSTWSMIGVANLTGGTLAGGAATLAAGTQGIAYSGVTLNLGAAGTYTFTGATCIISMTPTAPSTYALANGAFTGTMDLRNTTAHAITVEMPTGSSSTTANNTGGTITVTYPVNIANISITSMPDAAGASNRLQIINATALTAAARANSTAYSLGAIRLRQTGIGTENTAGLYLRCTTAGTSAGAPPTWNTTPGGTTADGTVTWTTYKVLFHDADPAGTSYSTTYTEGNEFLAGESVEIRFAEMDAGTSFKTYNTTTIASSSGFSVAVAEEADDVYATNALDGSAYESTYSPNFIDNYVVLDSNTDFAGKSAYAYFCYTLTSSNGMYRFWGGVTALDVGNYRIESDILNLYFDETAGFVKQTDDVRIFRKDGLRPALDPTTGGSGIEINWRVPVNVVSTGGSALTATQDAHLMALANAPAAATVADAVHDEVIEAGKTFRELTRINAAVLAGKVSGAGTATETFKGIDGTTDRVVSTVDASGNRTAVAVDGA